MKTGMIGRFFSEAGIFRRAGVAVFLVALAPSIAFATHFELSRLAVEIELISDQLADELRYTRHYGSVRQRAVTLRREASQLADALRRNRSNSRIRSQFKDVRRSYERLEQAFFVADRRDHDPRVYSEINLLSNVFTNLSDEFYYAGLGGQRNAPFYDVPYGGLTIIGSSRLGSSRAGLGRDRSRHVTPRQYNNRNRGRESSGRIVPNRERAIPPVFRGNNSQARPNRQGGRVGGGGTAAPNRGTRGLQRAPVVEHRSNVLERQGRQNRERRELESRARGNRSSSVRQPSGRANVQRPRGSRGSAVESRRRNHYE